MARRGVVRESVKKRRRVRRNRAAKALMLLIGVTSVLGAAAFCRKLARPIVLCCKERSAVKQLLSERTALEIENRRLRDQKNGLRSDAGAQAEARKLGYVRPGEICIILGDDKPEEKH